MKPLEITTIAEYQQTAASFREGTWNHDVSQNRNALIAVLPRNPGRILDFGCGPGRDLVAFKALGHTVVGLDATPAFVQMAREALGLEETENSPIASHQNQVWQQNFLSLDLPTEYFDGIFANASLLHVPHNEMTKVLGELYRSLVPGGAIVMSLARGAGEGFIPRPTGERYTSYWELETIAPHLEAAGFEILDHYYRPPGLPRDQQSWVAIVARRSPNSSVQD